ncbi:MAG: hypothetical protein JJ975_10560 [Bacteroidia bacterium]|nr:hypothetical protein [Bacteroidia bacterium]
MQKTSFTTHLISLVVLFLIQGLPNYAQDGPEMKWFHVTARLEGNVLSCQWEAQGHPKDGRFEVQMLRKLNWVTIGVLDKNERPGAVNSTWYKLKCQLDETSLANNYLLVRIAHRDGKGWQRTSGVIRVCTQNFSLYKHRKTKSIVDL